MTGFLLTWWASDGLWPFTADALLSVGVAIGLVGVVLRVQLDLQDELDDAQRARARFEEEMRRDVAVIDRRVSEALSRLPEEDTRTRGEATRLAEDLARQLELARQRVSELEGELQGSRRPEHGSLLSPVAAEDRAGKVAGAASSSGGNSAGMSPRLARFIDRALDVLVVLGVPAIVLAAQVGLLALLTLVVPGGREEIASSGIWEGQRWGWEVWMALTAVPIAFVFSESRRGRIAYALGFFLGPNALVAAAYLLRGVF